MIKKHKFNRNLKITLTTQLRKTANKKRASHPSSTRELNLDFKKLVDKLEQAEIQRKLEKQRLINYNTLIESKPILHT